MSTVFLIIMLDTNLLLTFKDLVSLRWTFWLFVCIIQEDIGFQKTVHFQVSKSANELMHSPLQSFEFLRPLKHKNLQYIF